MSELLVVRAGPLTTVQDRGRPGLAHLGVPPSGAADLRSFELGNALVGNDPAAAALEATLVGPTLRFDAPALVAVTGAEAGAMLDGRPLVRCEPREGSLLELGPCTGGVRVYVAARGGIDVAAVLGSRSHDVLTGLGPPPLRDGDVLPLGPELPTRAKTLVPDCYLPPPEPVLRVLPGPRADWFAPGALEALTSATWWVALASNRVGTRLEGPQLEHVRQEELLSEGLVTGALQVPAAGQPILLGPDHPTTGGYPVLAVVVTEDLPLAGQLAPGATVQFSIVTSVPIGV